MSVFYNERCIYIQPYYSYVRFVRTIFYHCYLTARAGRPRLLSPPPEAGAASSPRRRYRRSRCRPATAPCCAAWCYMHPGNSACATTGEEDQSDDPCCSAELSYSSPGLSVLATRAACSQFFSILNLKRRSSLAWILPGGSRRSACAASCLQS